jgi:hypothetical protein
MIDSGGNIGYEPIITDILPVSLVLFLYIS